jgi:hypothetical protein
MKKRSKGPPNLPTIGDLCRLRGQEAEGVCANINPSNLWTQVWWQGRPPSRETPTLCHLYELERLEFNH